MTSAPRSAAPPSTASVTVRVPATSANLGAGFDTLGLALDWTAEITLTVHAPSRPRPEDSAIAAIESMAVTAAAEAARRAGVRLPGLDAHYDGDLPVGRGLGMSAAARAAGIVAANRLLGDPLHEAAIVPVAIGLEGHGDNILPALYGGLQVVVHGPRNTATRVRVPPPDDLRLAMLVPEFSMPTEESRKRLPESLSREDAVANIGRASLMVAALTQGAYGALRVAVEDRLHQPPRGELFPLMQPLIDAAHEAGAYGAYLSGGGSSVAAFVSDERAADVSAAMLELATAKGLRAFSRVVGLREDGAEVVDETGLG